MLNKTLDILILLAVLLAITSYVGINGEVEDEAEFNPVEAKISRYCSLTENSPNIPYQIKQACREKFGNRNIPYIEEDPPEKDLKIQSSLVNS